MGEPFRPDYIRLSQVRREWSAADIDAVARAAEGCGGFPAAGFRGELLARLESQGEAGRRLAERVAALSEFEVGWLCTTH